MVLNQKEVWVIKAGVGKYPSTTRWFLFCVYEETEDNWKTYKKKCSYRSLPRDWKNKGDIMWWVQYFFDPYFREEPYSSIKVI